MANSGGAYLSKGERHTPMMKQFMDMKKKYPGTVLFFRMGDFYETFYDDARITSEALGITLTARGKAGGAGEKIPLAGIPHHALDTYLKKMVQKGHKVAICEQLEDPKLAKGIVKRGVTRVVTPGTILDGNMLDERAGNYLLSVLIAGGQTGVAFVDVSTGEFKTTQFETGKDHSRLRTELVRFKPSEIIMTHDAVKDPDLIEALRSELEPLLTPLGQSKFDPVRSTKTLMDHFQAQSILGLGLADMEVAARASGAALEYLNETQMGSLGHIGRLITYSNVQNLILDSTTVRNLELIGNIRDGGASGTLLGLMDSTRTPMGSRLLREWLLKPLLDTDEIRKRQDAVELLARNSLNQKRLGEHLKGVRDLARLTSRIVYGTANARDLISLRFSLEVVPELKNGLPKLSKGGKGSFELIASLQGGLEPLGDLTALIGGAIQEEPPLSLREGGLIQEGCDPDLDELKEATRDGKAWISRLEKAERERTGVKSLKVRYNKVFGYYIELTRANIAAVPEDYIRKQTLANSERFITPELKEKEALILGARERMEELEYQIFCGIRDQVAKESNRILEVAGHIALLDSLLSLSDQAVQSGYVRPTVNGSDVLRIKDGRHPVVERLMAQRFVPNDTLLDCGTSRLHIITGPNMAGKSTYMRQVALMTIMAQMGSYVPAKELTIGVVDRIFTRVGAFDDLTRGQSTFMMEMTELANILHNATSRSLVLLDEIGRGTATFDGLSIAWAVTEHLHNPDLAGCKSLFATHYHQLTELGDILEGVQNHQVLAAEEDDQIVFLHKVVPGSADKSYGVQVAQLAGVPDNVIARATEVLRSIEKDNILEVRDSRSKDTEPRRKGSPVSDPTPSRQGMDTGLPRQRRMTQLVLFDPNPLPHPALKELIDVDVLNMTPVQALQRLEELQELARDTDEEAARNTKASKK